MLLNDATRVLRAEPTRQPRPTSHVLTSDQGASFDPEGVAAMIVAYHAVLAELRLPDREDAGTRMVASRVIEMAAKGERDARRIADATLEALSR
jgi:hypothetical protein